MPRGSKPHFDRDLVERLYLEDKTRSSELIAKDVGCSASLVNNILRERGHSRKPGIQIPELPDALDLIAEKEMGNLSWAELGRRYGVDPNTIKNHADVDKVRSFQDKEIDQPFHVLQTSMQHGEHLGDVNDLLRKRGLDPAHWIVHGLRVNEWDAPGPEGEPQQMKQLKAYLKKRVTADDLIQPVTMKPLKLPAHGKRPERPERVELIYGDNQEPYGDPAFKRLLLRLVKQLKPDTITDLGDGMDMPTVSRHPRRAHDPSAQECFDTYGQWLYDLRRAAGDAAIFVLGDNHVTDRLERYQLDRAAEMYGVTPALIRGLDADLDPLWSVKRILRLDELGVEYVNPGSKHYAQSYREIIPGELVVIHGYRTGQQAAKKFVEEWGCSVIYGHLHTTNGRFVTDSSRMGVGKRRRLWGLPVGCVGSVDRPDYAPGADHQQSALLVRIWPDGTWTPTELNYADGVLSGGEFCLTDEETG